MSTPVPPERPANYPHPDEPLLEAARYNDAQAEEFGLDEHCKRMGMNLDVLRHAAEQRAMRVVLARNPERAQALQEAYKKNNHTTAFAFNILEQMEIAKLTAVYMDGIALGWRASEIVQGRKG